MKRPKLVALILVVGLIALVVITRAEPQQQISGSPSVTISQGGNNALVTAGGLLKVDASGANVPVTGTFWQATQPVSGTVTINPSGTQTVTGAGGTFPISGNIGNAAFGVNAGAANIGIVRVVPSPCTQSANFSSSTVGVATGVGTSVTSTTTCVTVVYVSNTTNSAVTFRLQDKAGTPVIWIGGNADFTILANNTIQFPINGVLFTSGITAIAGTAAALNLFVAGLQ